MFNILDRYIGRVVFWSVMICDFALIGLSGLIKFVDQLRSVGDGNYDTGLALYYTLLNIPVDLVQFFPLAILLGGLIGLGSLASSSELVVMQASGRSKMSIIGAVLKTVIPMVLAVMLISEFVSPIARQMGENIRIQALSGGTLSVSIYGVWAKDGASFVNIGSIDHQDNLHNIRIYQFDNTEHLKQIVDAKAAKYQQDHWQLSQVTTTEFTTSNIKVDHQDTQNWYSSLTLNKLSVVSIDPDEMSLRTLIGYIHYLQQNHQDTNSYQLEMWRKLFTPLTVIAMMLLASSFVFGPLRTMPMGTRILFGIIAGFVFYVIDQIFGPMTLIYGMPPLVGALIPAILFLMLAFYLINRKA